MTYKGSLGFFTLVRTFLSGISAISSSDGYLNEVDGPQGCRKLASIVSVSDCIAQASHQ